MPTQFIFTAIVAAVIIQRLLELRISQRNVAALLAQGGQVQNDNLLSLVKGLQVSWWLAMLAEVWWLGRPFIPWLAAIALLLTMAGQVLRFLSMKALGTGWTLPILTIPDQPVVSQGIYRYLRHPNWLGVMLEIVGLPLVHSAYWTALVFAIANLLIMRQRIRTEEKALSEHSNYLSIFANTPRLIPHLRMHQTNPNQPQGREWT